jgi:hypothetical protein
MGRNAGGQTLNDAVGAAGISWNQGWIKVFFNAGYPGQDVTFNLISDGPGQYLRSCAAESRLPFSRTLGMGCNWGPGISGGPWLLGYQAGLIAGTVNSVNSGFFFGLNDLYGARFTQWNIVPLCQAAGCIP